MMDLDECGDVLECNMPEMLIRDLELSEAVFTSKAMTAGCPTPSYAVRGGTGRKDFHQHHQHHQQYLHQTLGGGTKRDGTISHSSTPYQQHIAASARAFSLAGLDRRSSLLTDMPVHYERPRSAGAYSDSSSASSLGMDPSSPRLRQQSVATAATSVSGRCSSSSQQAATSPSVVPSSSTTQNQQQQQHHRRPSAWLDLDDEDSLSSSSETDEMASSQAQKEIPVSRICPEPANMEQEQEQQQQQQQQQHQQQTPKTFQAMHGRTPSTARIKPSRTFPLPTSRFATTTAITSPERPHTSSGASSGSNMPHMERPRIIDIQPPSSPPGPAAPTSIPVPRRRSSLMACDLLPPAWLPQSGSGGDTRGDFGELGAQSDLGALPWEEGGRDVHFETGEAGGGGGGSGSGSPTSPSAAPVHVWSTTGGITIIDASRPPWEDPNSRASQESSDASAPAPAVPRKPSRVFGKDVTQPPCLDNNDDVNDDDDGDLGHVGLAEDPRKVKLKALANVQTWLLDSSNVEDSPSLSARNPTPLHQTPPLSLLPPPPPPPPQDSVTVGNSIPSPTSPVVLGVPLPPEVLDTLRISTACFPETMLLSSSLSVETIRTYSKKLKHGTCTGRSGALRRITVRRATSGSSSGGNGGDDKAGCGDSVFSFGSNAPAPSKSQGTRLWNLPRLMVSRRGRQQQQSTNTLASPTETDAFAESLPATAAPGHHHGGWGWGWGGGGGGGSTTDVFHETSSPPHHHHHHHQRQRHAPAADWVPIKTIFPAGTDYLCDALYAHLVAYNYINSLFGSSCPSTPTATTSSYPAYPFSSLTAKSTATIMTPPPTATTATTASTTTTTSPHPPSCHTAARRPDSRECASPKPLPRFPTDAARVPSKAAGFLGLEDLSTATKRRNLERMMLASSSNGGGGSGGGVGGSGSNNKLTVRTADLPATPSAARSAQQPQQQQQQWPGNGDMLEQLRGGLARCIGLLVATLKQAAAVESVAVAGSGSSGGGGSGDEDGGARPRRGSFSTRSNSSLRRDSGSDEQLRAKEAEPLDPVLMRALCEVVRRAEEVM